jgi:hypothetical protein
MRYTFGHYDFLFLAVFFFLVVFFLGRPTFEP